MKGKTIHSRHWLVYILRCRDGSYYTGITNDLSKRLQAHRDGKASRYTRSRLPVQLVYLESAANRSAAIKRELVIKRMRRRQKEVLLRIAKTKMSFRMAPFLFKQSA
jgi:predicted GIY-YIG superfamily endonuclease